MTTRKQPARETKPAVPQVNPIVRKAADQVAARKARRWGKDLRGDCPGQIELELFPPDPKPRRGRRRS
ncbi:hypothetical protein [Nocardia otitidiscaviarum]|uniref:hypothetical protein n=1 Tax=Nocardia otitidiscaviarum TaxID=1823 RepID=UPI002456BF4B|nr:hypothetical protein [Nocardia otitidiscaviarum]